MSANNQLIIRKPKRHKNSLYEVHQNLCVDNEFKPNTKTLLKRFKTLKEAIFFANKYQEENIVEYGVYVSPECWKDEKQVVTSKTIEEAIDNLRDFFECDLWSKFKDCKIKGEIYERKDKFKSEGDLIKYLREHFNILESEVNGLLNKGVRK